MQHSFRSVGLILISLLSHVELLWIPVSPTADKNAVLYRRRGTVKNKLLWRSSLIIFLYEVHGLLYGASETGNPLTVRGKILQPILVKKCASSIQIKITDVLVWTSFPVFTVPKIIINGLSYATVQFWVSKCQPPLQIGCGARNYRYSFCENKPKTIVFSYWIRAFWACFHENAGL